MPRLLGSGRKQARCDASLRAELLANIVLSGGAAAMPGLADRLRSEVAALAAAAAERLGGVAPPVHVSAPPPRAPLDAAGGGRAARGAPTPPLAEPNPLYEPLECPLPEAMEGGMQQGYLESHAKAVRRAATCEHSAWLGGSLLASEAAYPQRWLSIREYLAEGPAAVHSKCF